MKKQALYRSFRSKTFTQQIGQEHITRILENQVSSQNISHAYLFCGTRGTGKTSTALILSRAVNCLDPIGGNPCGKCSICMLKDNPDIWEIDAASNNGVDQIRELRDNVRFSPMESKYKVYIIDEVHMLSTGAFNALLKTLEEPPAHVIFILATTEPQKLPATILSRCQRFDFRRIPANKISPYLKKVIKQTDESIEYEDKAVDKIALLADGSMRDALSLLDQCLFSSENKLSLKNVAEAIGAVDDADRFDLVDAILAFDTKSALILADKLINYGMEPASISRDLSQHLRNISIALSCGMEANSILELGDEEFARILDQSTCVDLPRILKLAETFSYLQLDIRRSISGRILFESAIIRCCNVDEYSDIASLASRVSAIEQFTKNNPPVIRKSTLRDILPEATTIPNNIGNTKDKEAEVIAIAAEDSHSQIDNNMSAKSIFLELQNVQKEGIKRIFSMYEWNETLQNSILYLTPPKGCLPALLNSLIEKQAEFSEAISEKFPGVSLVFSASPAANNAPEKQNDTEESLEDKVEKLFGTEAIKK